MALVAVVDHGSFSDAAERLDIAKSAVSRRVTDLEARLGVRLLNRTTRRVNLTEPGRVSFTSGPSSSWRTGTRPNRWSRPRAPGFPAP